MSRPDRRTAVLTCVSLVAAGWLAACSSPSGTAPTGAAGAGVTDPDQVAQVGDLETLADGAALAAGRYSAAFAGTAGDARWATMSVPTGFVNAAGWLRAGEGSHERGLQLWTVDQVNVRPCGATHQRDVGPTAADLVRAVERLRVRRPTAAVRTSVDGHAGWYLEMSVPGKVPCLSARRAVPLAGHVVGRRPGVQARPSGR